MGDDVVWEPLAACGILLACQWFAHVQLEEQESVHMWHVFQVGCCMCVRVAFVAVAAVAAVAAVCRSLGFSGMVGKPFSKESLQDAFSRALRRESASLSSGPSSFFVL